MTAMPQPVDIRENRINILYRQITEEWHGKTTRTKVYTFCLSHWIGLTTRTIDSYLRTLELAGKIQITNDGITKGEG